ncbi:MAG: ABC transporter ATP-binding protein [Candidatus Brocadiia bacterium]
MDRLRQILAFLRPYKRPLVLAIVLTGALTLVGMAPPLLMRRLITDVAGEGEWGPFPLLMTLLFAVPLLRAGINAANSIALNRVAQGIIRDTRRRLFTHLMRLSMRFYDETPVGAIHQRLTGDVANISTVATGGVVTLSTDVLAVGFAVVVMLGLSPKLSLLTFALLPLYFLNYRFFSHRIQAANAQLRSRMDHISSMLQERLSAHELIQSYGQEKAQATHFSSQAKSIMDAAVRGSAYSISFNQLSAFINKLGNTAIYGAGCYFFVRGAMAYGDVVAFCAYATQLLGPVVRLSSVMNQLAQVGVSVDRVDEILSRRPAIQERPDATAAAELQGTVRIRGLTFGYEKDSPVLQDLDLEVPAGADLALVGAAGSGRSTLAMLLRRFYEPQEGAIEVDGQDIRGLRLQDYRRALALVLPDSAILDGTIRENLRYGKPDAPTERVVEVAEAVGLHSFVASLPEGYETRLGTGGIALSAGVRQQIGIARALLSEPFILIMDEATASLDPDSAEAVNQAVRQAMAQRTCILIVHRMLMARDADRVTVLHEGQVAEEGTHEELIARQDGLYRTLYALQYGEQRLPPAQER